MKADDKTEILLSHVDLAQGIKETVRSCQSPGVTDLENRLVIYFQRNEPKMMKADLENSVIMHEKNRGLLSVISGENLAVCLTCSLIW